MNMERIAWFKLRVVMALIFLWTFADKLFGLGFSTLRENSWINGGSPTYGYLNFAVEGPFAGFFKSLAGMPIIDWMFMFGLLFVGLTLLINRFVIWGAIAGILMMVLMWLSTFPPEHNPFIDEHIVYALILALLAFRSKKLRN